MPAGTTIVVNSAAVPGLTAINPGGQITADNVTIQLGPGALPRNFVGASTQAGGIISLNGSTIVTNQAAASQRGVVSSGAGSNVTASGASITLGTGVTVTDNIAVLVQSGGGASFVSTVIATLGGANGSANHALVATGPGSTISFNGGSLSTASRGSFGVQAVDGGSITLTNGTQITTTGVQIVAGNVGSHGLYATGASSQIGGTAIGVNVSGQSANAARAENGGIVSLSASTIVSSSVAAADIDPSSALRVLSGGRIVADGSTITSSGLRGHALSVQDSGSLSQITDSTLTADGSRANAAFVFDGGRAEFTRSSLSVSAANSTAIAVQGAGSSVSLLDSIVSSAGQIGYGLRASTGAVAALSGGSITTGGRDAPGLAASGGASITATNVDIRTTGSDNALGALADGDGRISLTGGSIRTSGDAVRQASFPHGVGARNPGALLEANGTSIVTTGLTAMGAVADDGGVVRLSGNSITTSGTSSLGLFSVTEQVGSQFAAMLSGTGLTIETFGERAHGAQAQARNDLPVPIATLTLSNSSITTHGANAVGLRSVLGDYGSRPVLGRGESAIVANETTVRTEGVGSHGALSRDAPTSVTTNRSSLQTSGAFAHGTVAEFGGRIIGNDTTVNATGPGAAALYVTGTPTAISTGVFERSTLTNVSGPTIGVGGSGNVTLTNSFAGGSGEWLRVGASTDFPPLAAPGLPLFGIPDPDAPDAPPSGTPTPPTAVAATPGAANILLTNSNVVGSAFTAPGSISNLTLVDSTWIMTGNSNITNLVNDPSLIQFTPPTADPNLLSSYKTLTVVNYLGVGGVLGLNTLLGTDTAPSDRLIVDGGTATGSSPLHIANTIGRGALTVADGILVVNAINGATTAPGAFSLSNVVAAGPYEYGLFRSGVTPGTENNWYLRSTIDCTASGAPSPPCPPPGPTPSPPVPNFRLETSLYAAIPAMTLLYGRNLLDTLHERVGEEEDQRGRTDKPNVGWARFIGMTGHRDSKLQIFGEGPRYDYDFAGLQAGHDLYRADRPDGSRDHSGFYVAAGDARGAVSHFDGRSGKSNFEAYSIGGYWTHFGRQGWYIDAVAQGTLYNATSSAARGVRRLETDGHGFGASLEAGYPFRLANGFFIEPQVQAVYQRIRLDDASDLFADIRFDDIDSLAARFGVRFGRTWSLSGWATGRTMTAWIRPNFWHEFRGRPITEFSSADGFVPFRAELRGSWGEINAGVSGQVTDMVTAFANVAYQTRFEGKSFAYNGKLGLRVNW